MYLEDRYEGWDDGRCMVKKRTVLLLLDREERDLIYKTRWRANSPPFFAVSPSPTHDLAPRYM